MKQVSKSKNLGKFSMLTARESLSEVLIMEDEVLEWYSLSPAERFVESQRLWETFLLLGGDYDPEPDTQSPFCIFET